ncbi:hypothetical protein DW718_11650 [Weissella cibaria]|nr:hypothetical protein DW718_11650 [Weissella cibaria]
MGSATKDTASGFQHGDMKRLRDYISKSYAELGLWVAKHLRESTYNVILEGLRSFMAHTSGKPLKGRYTAPDALKV